MIGREKEYRFIQEGFSSTGKLRCALILGDKGSGKTHFLNKIRSAVSANEKKSIVIAPISSNCNDLHSLISSLIRDISIGSDLPRKEIGQFARLYGSKFSQIFSSFNANEDKNELLQELAKKFVTGLEDTLIRSNIELKTVIPIFIIDAVDQLDQSLLDWLSGPLNQEIRNSSLFTKCRFLFSAELFCEKIERFFAKFGFSNPAQITLPPFNAEQCRNFAESLGYNITDAEKYRLKSRGNPSKLLNIFKKPPNIKPHTDKMNSSDANTKAVFSDFSDKELNYLLHASYPSRINRYNLEFFCSPRDAAFCFNWLKRNKRISKLQPDGDLVLDEEFRAQMLAFHQQEEPKEAERMSTSATILDTFLSFFPDSNYHWIPVNLQIFESFTKDLCKRLFNETEAEEIAAFIKAHEEQFIVNGNQFSLKEEIKLVSQKFCEIGGGSPRNELLENAKIEWAKYQEQATEKRHRLEQEKVSLEEEAFHAEKQIISLDALKNQLLEDYNNPPQQKINRELSFTNSKTLIVLGLITIGLSLYFESLGSYSSACGIIFTILGFFWPNIEIKKQASSSTNDSPKLAIETQQRSLTHRMSGLASRLASIKQNLKNLTEILDRLEQGMNSPYVKG